MYRQADEYLPLTLVKPAEVLVCKGFDNSIRWQPGERLDHLFEQRCDQLQASGQGSHLAVDADNVKLTYADLDRRANQTARYLIQQGIRSGDRVGLLFKKSIHTYIALLAVLKVNAAYVPFDASFPPDRIAFMLDDAEIKAIVTVSEFQHHVGDLSVPVLCLDADEVAITAEKDSHLGFLEKGASSDQLCYIIYTSGSTGKPKGVAVNHASICNFVRVAGEVYGIQRQDRMYQGLTIAFDFSVEEIWVPWMVGATLVPGKADSNLVGQDLADFLIEKQVTAMCCVPTLLATIEQTLPNLRFLLVSGEACPHDLVVRWYHPERIFLNAYGPTEATVTATLTSLHPDKPVTIGGPLPTYFIVILDENENKMVEKGAQGEVCIAGIGLAEGYVNRPDLTEKVFIDDFLHLQNNPSRRIYRTGDLGCINDKDQIVYHGRIDTQVKIRGYRIELTEIESVLLQMPQIAQAVVNTYEAEPGAVELVAYYTLAQGASELTPDQMTKVLRNHVPSYMVPAFFEKMDIIPMLPSHKADRKKLPAPKSSRMRASEGDFMPPETEMERAVASILAEVLSVEQVSVEDHFFDDLGAHSLLMAQFSTKIREQDSIPGMSMRDIYLHPTIRQLSLFLQSKQGTECKKTTNKRYLKPTNLAYYTCGTCQFVYYYGFIFLFLWLLYEALVWSFASTDILVIYTRLFLFGIVTFLSSMFILPILMKWVLIGKWKKEKIPIWSFKYFRFWIVKQMIQNNPIIIFKKLPIYNLYLRLLGAKIGKNVVIRLEQVPVCTDLLSIGDNTILRKDSVVLGYKAESGYIYTGSVDIGKNSFVGEGTFLDINTVMEDDTQLGHVSSLQSGQRIPKGMCYHGSPAEETATNYCFLEPKRCSSLRRFIYSLIHLNFISIAIPVNMLLLYFFFPEFFSKAAAFLARGNFLLLIDDLRFYIIQGVNYFGLNSIILFLLAISLVLFVAALVLGLFMIHIFPKFINLLIKADKTYVLYGVHYFIFSIISKVTNPYFFGILFGDSSYVLNYLNLLGYKASKRDQTGSNFGQSQKHDTPFLCEVGKGTMISDGLSMINAEMSNSSFRLSRAAIGDYNFFGNSIYYPTNGKTGDNCLVATKTMIPVDGPVRENIGLLGSPCFEIPRATNRDRYFNRYKAPDVKQQRIHKKNHYNLYTIACFLFFQWGYAFLSILLGFFTLLAFAYYGFLPLIVAVFIFPIFTIGYFIFVERMSIGFKRMKPTIGTIYDPVFWKLEHYWKLTHAPIMELFKGTPFKNVITRLLGVKLGKKVFDDGLFATEKTMLEIGDYCNFNEYCTIQCHSIEEGVLKTDYIKIGTGSTLGCSTYIHYGVNIGENAIIAPDAFVMKGESIDSKSKWQGNPAREV